MRIIEAANYKEMSVKAAQLVIEKVRSSDCMTLGLATGGTPKGLYEELILDHRMNGTSYQCVTTFNLDEYIGLSKDDPNSYYQYMYTNFFSHIDIPLKNTHIPSGQAVDVQAECKRYDSQVKDSGGIDLQILGIGENGHIGFNEPGTSFSSGTHLVELTSSTREANARYFSSFDEVPRQAITMGISGIMKSKEILLLVSGVSKQDAMKKLFEGQVTEKFPASILNEHGNVTVIADTDALKLVKPSR
ncbi:glucosamine-6-phosphate deaminase [Rossellomorea aquimaris]|uniref:glucosamine-6-phosphate deaminase n=1 Tax=Rossellomorea aquimaris TaxID=189382 RepID=UPI001CD2FE09|nr:glucosamine-6-phosphate deaminase [Rossellomorea aquimaris]MCA1055663.1 glucosamine-6-phosphate deaminase [Rossellomorea aquimaris]